MAQESKPWNPALIISIVALVVFGATFKMINNSVATSSSSYVLKKVENPTETSGDTTKTAMGTLADSKGNKKNPIKPPKKLTQAQKDSAIAQEKLIKARMDSIKNQTIIRIEKKYIHYEGSKNSKFTNKIAQRSIFNNNPTFLFWVTLILIMVTIASWAASFYGFKVFSLSKEYEVKWYYIVMLFFFAVIVIGLIGFVIINIDGLYSLNSILKDFGVLFKEECIEVPQFISFMTMGLTIPIVMTIFLISRILQTSAKMDDLKEYISINKTLTLSLQTLAVIIVFAVLTSSTLRLSIQKEITYGPESFNLFPEEFSYIYGLLFSLFLAIVYVPVHIQSQQTAKLLTEKYEKEATDNSLLDKIKKDSSILENLKLILTIILPFISSLLPASLKILE